MSLTTVESDMGLEGSGGGGPELENNNQTTTTAATTSRQETTTFLPATDDHPPYFRGSSNATTTPRPMTMTTRPEQTVTDFRRHDNDVSAPLSTTLPPPIEHDGSPNMLIVGLGCSALGVLIGIILTCAIWSMYRRHRRRRGGIGEKHHAPAIEKNPKERTFEPLDMSLTKSNYGVATTPASNRVQFERFEAPSPLEVVVIPDHHSGSYMRFEPPTPPQMPTADAADDDDDGDSRQSSRMADQQQHHVISHQPPPPVSIPLHEMRRQHLSNLPAFHGSSVETEASVMDTNKQPYSNSLVQRDSFSSGRGTGTDSDTIPTHTEIMTNPPPQQQQHYHNNHHHRSKPQQETTTTHHNSNSGGPKQRVANNSNASSTATSSGWSTTLAGKHDDDDAYDSSEVLSSYFDMHFPNANGVDTPFSDQQDHLSRQLSSSTLASRRIGPDETIDL